MRDSFVRYLSGALLLRLFCAYGVIVFSGVGLSPDEAQYWTWAKDLDWGYYSKPPGIAWQIALSSYFFSDTHLGVRFFAPILSSITAYLLFFTARALGFDQRQSFWVAVVYAFSPLGFLSCMISTTDVGMLVFLLAALFFFSQGFDWKKVGICIGLGALFRWTIYVLWPLFFVALFLSGQRLKNPRAFLQGLLLSLLGLVPSLYWNVFHDFATFLHVGMTLLGGSAVEGGNRAGGNFWEFLGAQVGMLSPLFWVLLWLALWRVLRMSGIPYKHKALAWMAVITLSLGHIWSLFQKVQPNWMVFAYPFALLLLPYLLPKKERLFRGALLLSVFLGAGVLFLSIAQPALRWNPLKQALDWPEMTPVLAELGYQADEDFLFARSYQMTSLLSFYGPLQKRAYFFNYQKRRQNQFSFWPQMQDRELGKRGFFVLADEGGRAHDVERQEKSAIEQLMPFFDKVYSVGRFPLARRTLIVLCAEGYNGSSPPPSQHY